VFMDGDCNQYVWCGLCTIMGQELDFRS
jgi:hypothetical protein